MKQFIRDLITEQDSATDQAHRINVIFALTILAFILLGGIAYAVLI